MAKTVYLLRHAKAARALAGQPDRDRPLTDAGLAEAEALAAYLARAGARPDVVLCSAALRARQTLAPIAQIWGDGIATAWRDELYNGGADALLAAINALADAHAAVLLVGHNPALEELAAALVGSGASEARTRLARDFPPGAMAAITFAAANWRGVKPRGGHLQSFVTATAAAHQNVPG